MQNSCSFQNKFKNLDGYALSANAAWHTLRSEPCHLPHQQKAPVSHIEITTVLTAHQQHNIQPSKRFESASLPAYHLFVPTLSSQQHGRIGRLGEGEARGQSLHLGRFFWLQYFCPCRGFFFNLISSSCISILVHCQAQPLCRSSREACRCSESLWRTALQVACWLQNWSIRWLHMAEQMYCTFPPSV